MSNSRSRRAFTLVDLLAATACVALAGAVLLPALARSRNASQGDTSRSNLKVLMRAHVAYTIMHQDRWMNPFNPTTSYLGQPNSFDPEWYSARVASMPGYLWRFDDAGYETEMFSMHWASIARPGPMATNAVTPEQFDPRDQRFINRLNTLATAPGGLQNWLWPTSYMYSPTMWFNPARYAPDSRLSISRPNLFGGVRSVRYNTVAETLYPSRKAVLFQRFDFDQSSRPGPSGPVPLPPQWNNTKASPDVAFADGSVDEVPIFKVVSAINEDAAVAQWLRPTGPGWNMPTMLLNSPSVGYEIGDDWENGQNNTTAWQAFFWGTRNGVAGRDVPRR